MNTDNNDDRLHHCKQAYQTNPQLTRDILNNIVLQRSRLANFSDKQRTYATQLLNNESFSKKYDVTEKVNKCCLQ